MKNKDSFRTFLCRQVPTKTAQGSQLGPRFIPTVMSGGAAFFCLLSILSEAYACFCQKEALESFHLATLR